jgi:5-oxoprolinase (ATP-hydrolysing)
LDLFETSSEPRYINIGGKATIWMGKEDRLLIETPGGGAWGSREGAVGEVEDDGEGGGEGEAVGVGVGTGKNEDGGNVHLRKEWVPRGSLAERAATQAAF